MRATTALERLGGVADAGQLMGLTSRRRVETALRRGEVLRIARGRYALPTAGEGLRAARRLAGVASHLSAAAHYGWQLKNQPAEPWVTLHPKRKVPAARRAGVRVCWRVLDEPGPVTTRGRTVVDCARDLPFDEALAVAYSALREGRVTAEALHAAAQVSRGRTRVLKVLAAADERAASAFESVLRAQAIEAGLILEPQVLVRVPGLTCRLDLADPHERLVVEADSFAWHGDRRALHRDCRRYTLLALAGWRVIRFSWEDVMRDPDYVRGCLLRVRTDRKNAGERRGSAA